MTCGPPSSLQQTPRGRPRRGHRPGGAPLPLRHHAARGTRHHPHHERPFRAAGGHLGLHRRRWPRVAAVPQRGADRPDLASAGRTGPRDALVNPPARRLGRAGVNLGNSLRHDAPARSSRPPGHCHDGIQEEAARPGCRQPDYVVDFDAAASISSSRSVIEAAGCAANHSRAAKMASSQSG
jgi:hypothetical protein